jgi:hypothetical protein
MQSITTIGLDIAKSVFQVHDPNACNVGVVSICELIAQYSSASMMVMTRSVTAGSAGSGE